MDSILLTRKWCFDYLLSPRVDHKWEPDQINKLLYVVAEKYIRDKNSSTPHVENFNMLLTHSLLEILEQSQDSCVWMKQKDKDDGSGFDHCIFIENIRIERPVEVAPKTGQRWRILTESATKRSLSYTFGLKADFVYKVFEAPLTYPTRKEGEPLLTVEEKAVFEKEWLKLRELKKKEIGIRNFYAQFPPEKVVVKEVFKNCSLGPLPCLLGSYACHSTSPTLLAGENVHEPQGVFLLSGTYRIVSSLRDLMINSDFVEWDSKVYTSEIWSSAETKLNYSTNTLFLFLTRTKDKNGQFRRDIELQLPFAKQALDIVLIFFALGWRSDMFLTAVRLAARANWKPGFAEILNVIIQNAKSKCISQEEAFLAIAHVENKNLNERKDILINAAKSKICHQLLPRLGTHEESNNLKARYLAYLVWRLLMMSEQQQQLQSASEMEEVSKPSLIYCLGDAKDEMFEIKVPSWMKVTKQGDIRWKKKHRDHLANCRSDFNGVLLGSLFRQTWGKAARQMKNHFAATLNQPLKDPSKPPKTVSLPKFFKNTRKIAERVKYCVATGKFSSSKDRESRKGVSTAFSMNNHMAQESHLTYQGNTMNNDSKNPAPRQINKSQAFNICPAETPETKKCGLASHAAQAQEISQGSSGRELEKTLQFWSEELWFIPDYRWVELYRDAAAQEQDLEQNDLEAAAAAFDKLTVVFITGKPVGYTPFPEKFVRFFWTLRRTLTIDPFASIRFDPVYNNLEIRTDRGRCAVPFLIFPRLHHLWSQLPSHYKETNVPPVYIAAQSGVSFHSPAFVGPRAMLGLRNRYKHDYNKVSEDPDIAKEQEIARAVLPWTTLHNFHMWHLIGQGLMEFLDPSEREMTVILMQEADYWERSARGQGCFTHIALDAHFLLSITTGQIPMPDHNQSPRTTYQVAMGKSTIDSPWNLHIQAKTRHESYYCTAPFLHTISNGYRLGFLSNSNHEPILGLMPYFGYSVEDAQNHSKAFTQRGAGIVVTTKTTRIDHKKKKSSSSREAFGKPNEEECVNLKFANFKTITEEGIPLADTRLHCGDVMIGQTSHFRHPMATNLPNHSKANLLKKKRRCNSVVYNQEEPGVVYSALTGTGPDGTQFCRVQVRYLRVPKKGDKFTNMSAQKGTASVFYTIQDAPEFADGSGVILEHLINPQALPKRMTCAMLVEMAFSSGVANGQMRFGDGTSFRDQMCNLADLRSVLKKYGLSARGVRVRCGKTGRQIQTLVYVGCSRLARLKHIRDDKVHVRSTGGVSGLTRQPLEGRSRNGGLRVGEMELQCITANNAALLLRQQTHDIADAYKFVVCMKCKVPGIQPLQSKTAYCNACKGNDVVMVDISYGFKLLFQELFAMMIFTKMNVKKIPPVKMRFIKQSDLCAS